MKDHKKRNAMAIMTLRWRKCNSTPFFSNREKFNYKAWTYETCTLSCLIIEHARLFIIWGISILLALIWPCSFIIFLRKFQPARLFGPARLLIVSHQILRCTENFHPTPVSLINRATKPYSHTYGQSHFILNIDFGPDFMIAELAKCSKNM